MSLILSQNIKHGTYYYPTHGEKIIRLALDILTGKPFERDNPLLGFVVTPDNVDLVTTEATELMRQNDHMVTIHDKLEAYFGLYNTQHKVLIGSFVAIVLLIVAFIMMWRAYVQTRKAIKQRQDLNVEETLFYTYPDSRKLRRYLRHPKKMFLHHVHKILYSQRISTRPSVKTCRTRISRWRIWVKRSV